MVAFLFAEGRCAFIPRQRLPEGERKENLGVRLPQWMIEKIDELGDRTEVVEKAVALYLKHVDKKGK